MALADLFPQLQTLSRAEKLHVMQFLVSELAHEEAASLLQPGTAYPVWSPYDAHDAAAVLLDVLRGAQQGDAEQ